MNKKIKVFVEGLADEKFFLDYFLYLGISNVTIIITNGKDGLFKEAIINELNSNYDNGGLNLVFMDADDNFDKSKMEILTKRTKQQLSFELFLMPNNQSKGALEDLLENIINPDNQPIFDCWHRYEQDLLSVHILGRERPLTLPAKKTKMYAYLEVLLGRTKSEKELIKEPKRNYLNKIHWNLDSDYLNPLKRFILLYCK